MLAAPRVLSEAIAGVGRCHAEEEADVFFVAQLGQRNRVGPPVAGGHVLHVHESGFGRWQYIVVADDLCTTSGCNLDVAIGMAIQTAIGGIDSRPTPLAVVDSLFAVPCNHPEADRTRAPGNSNGIVAAA